MVVAGIRSGRLELGAGNTETFVPSSAAGINPESGKALNVASTHTTGKVEFLFYLPFYLLRCHRTWFVCLLSFPQGLFVCCHFHKVCLFAVISTWFVCLLSFPQGLFVCCHFHKVCLFAVISTRFVCLLSFPQGLFRKCAKDLVLLHYESIGFNRLY